MSQTILLQPALGHLFHMALTKLQKYSWQARQCDQICVRATPKYVLTIIQRLQTDDHI